MCPAAVSAVRGRERGGGQEGGEGTIVGARLDVERRDAGVVVGAPGQRGRSRGGGTRRSVQLGDRTGAVGDEGRRGVAGCELAADARLRLDVHRPLAVTGSAYGPVEGVGRVHCEAVVGLRRSAGDQLEAGGKLWGDGELLAVEIT